MNHETLQALYQLDVAEVGEKEAAKRWEFYVVEYATAWRVCPLSPVFSSNRAYRRKPGIPWPKVMQDQEVNDLFADCVAQAAKLRRKLVKSMKTEDLWPEDAPEWANYGIVTYYESKRDLAPYGLGQTLIERPKPAKQKIDWSKKREGVGILFPDNGKAETGWIAWNCDEHTRGNPLPDGLVVEWYEDGDGCTQNKYFVENQNWNLVTRFRIVGIQEGWE